MTHDEFHRMVEDEAMILRIIAEQVQVSAQQTQMSSPEAGAGGQPPYSYFAPTLPIVTTDDAHGGFSGDFTADGTVVSLGNSVVTARGFVLSNSPSPTLSDGVYTDSSGGLGGYSANTSTPGFINGTVYIRAYATNAVGTAYGEELTISVSVCLVEGTMVSLYDGSDKPIEDIEFTDSIKVWDFDNASFASAFPLYIKKVETANSYNLLEFSDGSHLKTIVQHRIFNKQAGRFTWPMMDETPIGTITFNVRGEDVVLINKSVVNKEVDYYNIITNYHMNLFGNGILTSIGYNNLYPIENMKFVKDSRESISIDNYAGIPERYYHGLRLSEQRDISINDTIKYVTLREKLKKV